ncbi:MAG: NTP transferase domain-containing protein [Caldilineaceae bacterium SB0668_bin_21]|nr:NTP transferase domain-containing protein [Caldilineaceae bacterium SB0668_bin_21]MYC21356.1 NTP transferase domain-containing protein [Caldilineaceae bacterium SB0662_bin_25]
MYAVILAGGVGTRLWPRSRESTPKQFTDITGSGRTMIQATVARLKGLVSPKDTYVITGRRYAGLCSMQVDGLPEANVLVEPTGRNTAPAIALACAHLRRRDPQEVVAVLPADHLIQDSAGFQKALRQAELCAREGFLVVLGIEPTKAHTGYGYIQREDGPLPLSGDLPTFSVSRFLEKPDQDTAEQFLADGGYYWNGGIFVSRVERLLGEFERQMPELYDGLNRITDALGTREQESVLAEVWPTMPETSIDYGLMEGAKKVAVVPMQVGWNDMGSWDALESVVAQDAAGNYPVEGEVLPMNSRGNIIAADNRLVALIDVDDLIVIDAGDALLIGKKESIQQVKQVVAELQAAERNELL